MSWKNILKDIRILAYFALIVFSVVMLIPKPPKLIISKVYPNTTAYETGLKEGFVLFSIDDCKTKTLEDFYRCLKKIKENETVIIRTNKGIFYAKKVNNSLGFEVREEKDWLKFGIDITGGSKVVLKPVNKTDIETLKAAAEILENRLNAYGLKDVRITIQTDLEGDKYIVVELPKGEEKLIEILKRQGVFEAKIRNITVFTGKDIKYVCFSPSCSRVYELPDGTYRFEFEIVISKEAAYRMWKVLQNSTCLYPERHLSDKIYFYLDGKLVDSLYIDCAFKEKPLTRAVITGPGETKKDAYEKMRFLQTVLKSGALPVKLKIERIERISPLLGKNFLQEMLIAGIVAFILVSLLIYLRYKNVKIASLIVGNMLVELIATLAIAKAIGWTLDLPSLTGVVVAIGTGVDDQIIITDEYLKGKKEVKVKEGLKRAFFVIISSYIVFGSAMIPVFFSGVGMLAGFAVTTLIGITIGTWITRPAFAKLLEYVLR